MNSHLLLRISVLFLELRWVCVTCKKNKITKVYEGETSQSLKIWTAEHLKAYKKQTDQSVLYKHKLADHNEEEIIEFEIEVTGKFKDALTRQANEAVRINSRKGTEILPSKCEFNPPPLVRVVVEKKK